MTLNIDMTGTAYADEYNGGDDWGDRKYLVASLMQVCGMQRIKDEKSAEEFEWRLRVYSKVFDGFMSGGVEQEERFYSDIPKLVGVWTNVSQVAQTSWFGNVKRNWAMDVQGSATRAMKAKMTTTEVSA